MNELPRKSMLSPLLGETRRSVDEKTDITIFDQGMKSLEKNGYDTLEEVKKYLEISQINK